MLVFTLNWLIISITIPTVRAENSKNKKQRRGLWLLFRSRSHLTRARRSHLYTIKVPRILYLTKSKSAKNFWAWFIKAKK
ncbi:hypothetical protein MBAV_004469 [Candidatus Magnetobacterium bavaricum]|uniref:Uncharacterized protein n=1 Tax=Candidatus Magnetobacterium bavaricum TaxID=29290 RepID=A0A0F3GRL3_9BACT|nr:hypothetical protein MBAV_004469 [Candidatus Magnetobacterium bavaricum]